MSKKTFKKVQAQDDDGWSDWVAPTSKQPYEMACCDCGLVHDLEFQAMRVVSESENGWWKGEEMPEPYRVLFRARRNEQSTDMLRKRDKPEQ